MSLLQPRDRATLLDSLRPPTGFGFDSAVATTYSLHLEALLTAPLAFALYDSMADGEPADGGLEPVAVLEAVRRYAAQMVVFCQAGQIGVPPSRPVLAWLEGVVVPVTAPFDGGVFHPKVWVVRFMRERDGARVLRVLCLSRNLTFDRSWDTVLRLDSHVLGTEAKRAALDTEPLRRFLEGLLPLPVTPLADGKRAVVESLIADLDGATFALPDGCGAARFWPLGLPSLVGDPLPDDRRRTLTISPFVTAGRLEVVAGKGKGHTLVSREEELDLLPIGALEPFEQVFVLTSDADLSAPADVEVPGPDAVEPSVERDDEPGCSLSGLHAKVTVAETPSGTVVLTGSANATSAGHGRNVEFVTELVVPSLRIDDLLAPATGEPSLGNLLVAYSPPEAPSERDPSEALADDLDVIRRRFADTAFRGNVRPDTDSGFVLLLESDQPPLVGTIPEGLEARMWPVTMTEAHGADLDPASSVEVTFPSSLEGLTSFFAVELVVRQGDLVADTRFVISAPLDGVPENRHTRIIAAILRDRDRFIRYLLLLLGDPGQGDDLAGEAATWLGRGAFGAGGGVDIPLLEVLVRSLSRTPGRLDHVANLIDELLATDEGREVLPEGFEQVWAPIWTARRSLGDV